MHEHLAAQVPLRNRRIVQFDVQSTWTGKHVQQDVAFDSNHNNLLLLPLPPSFFLSAWLLLTSCILYPLFAPAKIVTHF